MPHAPNEVAIGGSDGALPCRQDAHIATQTGTASRGAHRAIRLKEDIHQPLIDASLVDRLGSGDDDAANTRVNGTPAQHLGCLAHICKTPVGARANDHLIYGDVTGLSHRSRVGRQMREGYRGGNILRIYGDDLRKGGIRIRIVSGIRALRTPI